MPSRSHVQGSATQLSLAFCNASEHGVEALSIPAFTAHGSPRRERGRGIRTPYVRACVRPSSSVSRGIRAFVISRSGFIARRLEKNRAIVPPRSPMRESYCRYEERANCRREHSDGWCFRGHGLAEEARFSMRRRTLSSFYRRVFAVSVINS